MGKRNTAAFGKIAKSDSKKEPKLVKIDGAPENPSGELDRVIHERMRLGIISALAANKKLSFSELKKSLNTTDGNISVHARKLEDAGYLICEKSFKGRKPLTEYRITKTGRSALTNYLNHMEALINSVRRRK